MNNIKAIDGLRDVACLLIVIFHTHSNSIRDFIFIENSWIAVDLFFVISGFVMMLNYGKSLINKSDCFEFIVKRIARLWPVLILCMFTYIFSEYLLQILKVLIINIGLNLNFSEFKIDDIDSISIFQNIFLIQGFGLFKSIIYNKPSWSVSAEFYVYILFSIIISLTHSREKIRKIIFISIIIISFYILNNSTKLIYSIYKENVLFRGFFSFFIGALVWELDIIDHKIINNNLYQIILIILISYMVINIHVFQMILPFVFGILLIAIKSERGFICKFLEFKYNQILGKLSYSMYLIHFSVLIFFNALDNHLSLRYRDISLCIYILVVVLLGYLINSFYEIPIKDYLYKKIVKEDK